MQNLNVIFMGTPEFSVPVLDSLIKNTHVLLVISKEDAYVGRKKILTPSPVKEHAISAGIEVFTPKKLKEDYQKILEIHPDLIVTCAYGQIVPKEVLNCARLGCINVHASLLPKYRGASPISAAIKEGEKQTGITIMYMDETLDTGNMIHQKEIDILDTDTLGSLTDKLSKLGAEALLEALPSIADGTNASIIQNDAESTYVSIIKRSDEVLDFNEPVQRVYNHIRSLSPSPLANTLIDGNEWKIVSATIGEKKENLIPGVISEIGKDYIGINCLDGILKVKEIKPFGKKSMSVQAFLNGCAKENLLNKKVGE